MALTLCNFCWCFSRYQLTPNLTVHSWWSSPTTTCTDAVFICHVPYVYIALPPPHTTATKHRLDGTCTRDVCSYIYTVFLFAEWEEELVTIGRPSVLLYWHLFCSVVCGSYMDSAAPLCRLAPGAVGGALQLKTLVQKSLSTALT